MKCELSTSLFEAILPSFLPSFLGSSPPEVALHDFSTRARGLSERHAPHATSDTTDRASAAAAAAVSLNTHQ